jgi:hypothetical protein
MRVVVAGDFREPILLDTAKATALMIYSKDGKPNTIFRIIGEGVGWIRYTRGEDVNFDEMAHSLGLVNNPK